MAWLNRLKLKQKLGIMQICCVILPLLLTDSVVAAVIMHAERQENLQEMSNIADSVEYTIMSYSAQLVTLMQDIYKNREVNEFISSTYTSPLDYYNRHFSFAQVSLFTLLMNNNDCNVVIYTDAEGIVNGGNFQRLEKAEGENWYQTFRGQDKKILLFADFAKVNWENRRTISFIRHMDYLASGDRGRCCAWSGITVIFSGPSSIPSTHPRYMSVRETGSFFPMRGGAASMCLLRPCPLPRQPKRECIRPSVCWTTVGIFILCLKEMWLTKQCAKICPCSAC